MVKVIGSENIQYSTLNENTKKLLRIDGIAKESQEEHIMWGDYVKIFFKYAGKVYYFYHGFAYTEPVLVFRQDNKYYTNHHVLDSKRNGKGIFVDREDPSTYPDTKVGKALFRWYNKTIKRPFGEAYDEDFWYAREK